MSADAAAALFWASVAAHGVLLLGTAWCIAVPTRRIYPMTKKTFVYYVMWALFWFVYAATLALVALDWNSGPWSSPLRWLVGVPVAASGAAFVTWGIATLGVTNTSGVRDGLVARGPYHFSRNPQYVGDIALFLGTAIVANSELVWVTQLLSAWIFVLAPLAEEPWLEEQYGDAYRRYCGQVPRFL